MKKIGIIGHIGIGNTTLAELPKDSLPILITQKDIDDKLTDFSVKEVVERRIIETEFKITQIRDYVYFSGLSKRNERRKQQPKKTKGSKYFFKK